MQGENTPLPASVSERCADLTAMLIRDSGFAEKFFNAMVRKMQEKNAGARAAR
jgi:hypothetical protein